MMATSPVMRIVPPYTPELLASVVSRLGTFLTSVHNPKVLEFGSGWSTVWFAMNGCRVTSFEHDAGWRREVRRVLGEEGLRRRVDVHLLSGEKFARTVHGIGDTFDLVYVDCIDGVRVSCTYASLSKLRPGGLLVLDDTHWSLWGHVPGALLSHGFTTEGVYEGDHVRKDGKTHHHHTTILRKGET